VNCDRCTVQLLYSCEGVQELYLIKRVRTKPNPFHGKGAVPHEGLGALYTWRGKKKLYTRAVTVSGVKISISVRGPRAVIARRVGVLYL